MTEQQPPPPPVPDAEQLRAAVEQLSSALRAWVVALTPGIRAAAQALAQVAEAVRTASRDDYDLAPPPPAARDRPAWRSPYGPAHTRRKH